MCSLKLNSIIVCQLMWKVFVLIYLQVQQTDSSGTDVFPLQSEYHRLSYFETNQSVLVSRKVFLPL